MWETICDAQAGFCTLSSNSKICVQILQKAPFWNFRSESPPPQWKTSDLRWPKFTPEYPPNEKLQIWDDQSLLRNTPPPNEKLQIWDDQSLLWNTPPNEKLQIWDDQSLLRNPPQWKTSDLRWPKFTPESPPPSYWWEFPYVETYIYFTDNILV